jgi:ribosomal protein S18 acetylase RimI-like enzyme
MPRRRANHRPGLASLVTTVRHAERSGPAAAGDRDFIAELGRRSIMSSVSSLRPTGDGEAREAFDRLHTIVDGQSNVTLIAESNGERVGFLLMLDELPDEVTLLPQAFIAYMAVEPGSWRAGVGQSLLEFAENEAHRRGLPYMALMVTEENEAARQLYERGGYRTERRLLCKAL